MTGVIPPARSNLFGVLFSRRGASMILLSVGILALLAALVSGGLSAQRRRGENQELYSHALEVLAAGREVLSSTQDIEIGERGYLLSGDPAYLIPYDTANALLDMQVASLRQLTMIEPRQQQLAAEVERHIGGLRLNAAQILALAREGKQAEAIALFRTDAGKKTMDAIRAAMTQLLAREEQRVTEQRQAAASSARIIAIYLGGLALVGLVLIIFAITGAFSALASGARADMEAERAKAALRLADSERRFRVITDAMPQIVWSSTPQGRFEFVNARWKAYTGSDGTAENWLAAIHPDDRAAVSEAWRHALATGETYEREVRLRAADGSYRWFVSRAVPVRDPAGDIQMWLGVGADVHETKLNMQARELISQELSHRIKNIFSVVGSLISLSARHDPSQAAFAAGLRNRVNALARAHEFVRPHSPQSASRTGPRTFSAFISDLLGAYVEGAPDRVTFTGEDFSFGDKCATPLALFFHELGTNAAKYGALSTEQGSVRINAHRDGDDIVIVWSERNGPKVEGEPTREGFGTTLARLSVEGQLDGSIAKSWAIDGLSVTVRIPELVLKQGRKPA